MIKLAVAPGKGIRARGCANCYWVEMGMFPDRPRDWQCGRTGRGVSVETSAEGSCGLALINWEPEEPSIWELIKRNIKGWLGYTAPHTPRANDHD